MEGKERLKKETDDSRLVGSRFNKQGNYIGGLLGQLQDVRILKVYVLVLTGFSHAFSPDGLNNTVLSHSCVLELTPTWEE